MCSEPTGVKCGDLYMSFKSIFQDCRDAVDWVHYKVRIILFAACSCFTFACFSSIFSIASLLWGSCSVMEIRPVKRFVVAIDRSYCVWGPA